MGHVVLPALEPPSRTSSTELSGKVALSGRPSGFLRRATLFFDRCHPVTQGGFAGLVLLLASIGSAWTCYSIAARAFRQTVDEGMLSVARLAALHIEPEAHARLLLPKQQNGPEYLALIDPLRRITSAGRRIRYIYTLRPSPEGLRFVLDTGDPNLSIGNSILDQSELGKLYEDCDPYLYQAVRTGQSYVTPKAYSDDWGTFFSAYMPVLGEDGRLECIVGVDMDASDFQEVLGRMRNALLLSFGVALIASSVAGTLVAIIQLSKRGYVDRLARSEQRYALAVNGANEGIWDWDLASNTLYLSNRLRSMIGVPKEDREASSLTDAFFDRVHPDDRERVQMGIRDHLERRIPYDVEYRFRDARLGERWVHSRGQAVWDDEGRPVRFVGSVGDVTDRVRLSQQLRRAARVDRLTRLPNRASLLRRLRRVIRAHKADRGGHFALLFLDFDRFKIVNDSLGHDAGDELLVRIASRIRANLRTSDEVLCLPVGTAARLGGDEFVVLLEGLQAPEDAVSVAERLLVVLSEPYHIKSFRVVSTASIGIALGDSRYDRAEDLLRDADTAMYEAKTNCRGSLAVFDESMRLRVRRRMQLEQGLRQAIDQDQLYLLYQPIVCLRTGSVVSVEALVRWDHPELGRISPVEFIPIAEECGLIVPLGERVLDRAFDQISRPAAGRLSSPISGVSINLARQHLLLPDLATRLTQAAHQAGIDPTDVHLEITEGAVMQNVDTARETLSQLQKAGFRLAIDDFGTGYSSLACLHQFPFELLKIDRLFLEGIVQSDDRAAIVRTITSLAAILGFRVVAEGIETAEQMELMRELGCDYGQGYYFCRPVRLSDVPCRVPLPPERSLRISG
jgi:diguanylate cyclase (GGDEF)-like protein/PAS domain S-box-containing protein